MKRPDYIVSEEIKEKYISISQNQRVIDALAFTKSDQNLRIAEQMTIAMVPAPTFHEERRAVLMEHYFKKYGLCDVHIDAYGNVIGHIKGKTTDKILIDAHMDTVFPEETSLMPVFEGNKIILPSINDDSSGLATLLGLIRAIDHGNIVPTKTLYFSATVEEEGQGSMGGIKKLLEDDSNFDACICLDCGGTGYINYICNGSRTLEFTLNGEGGQASTYAGKRPNPLYIAAKIISKISDIIPPEESKTSYNVSNFTCVNDPLTSSMATSAKFQINYRSYDQNHIEELHNKTIAIIEECISSELSKLGLTEGIEWAFKYLGNIIAATQDEHNPIIESLHSIFTAMEMEIDFWAGASSNAVIPTGLGIQSICIGVGGNGSVHRYDEFYEITEDMYKGPQSALLLVMMMVGIDDIQPA